MFGRFRSLTTPVRHRFVSFARSVGRDLVIQSGQAGCLMAVGDLISQVVIERRHFLAQEHSVSPERALRFLGLGCFLVGPSLFNWYRLLERCVGAAVRGSVSSSRLRRVLLRQTVVKVTLDQLVFAPVFLAGFMSVLATLQGNDWSTVKQRLHADYSEILVNNWRLWPLIQLGNFYLVPLRYRVLLVQTVAVFWNTYLSYKTNKV